MLFRRVFLWNCIFQCCNNENNFVKAPLIFKALLVWLTCKHGGLLAHILWWLSQSKLWNCNIQWFSSELLNTFSIYTRSDHGVSKCKQWLATVARTMTLYYYYFGERGPFVNWSGFIHRTNLDKNRSSLIKKNEIKCFRKLYKPVSKQGRERYRKTTPTSITAAIVRTCEEGHKKPFVKWQKQIKVYIFSIEVAIFKFFPSLTLFFLGSRKDWNYYLPAKFENSVKIQL